MRVYFSFFFFTKRKALLVEVRQTRKYRRGSIYLYVCVRKYREEKQKHKYQNRCTPIKKKEIRLQVKRTKKKKAAQQRKEKKTTQTQIAF